MLSRNATKNGSTAGKGVCRHKGWRWPHFSWWINKIKLFFGTSLINLLSDHVTVCDTHPGSSERQSVAWYWVLYCLGTNMLVKPYCIFSKSQVIVFSIMRLNFPFIYFCFSLLSVNVLLLIRLQPFGLSLLRAVSLFSVCSLNMWHPHECHWYSHKCSIKLSAL